MVEDAISDKKLLDKVKNDPSNNLNISDDEYPERGVRVKRSLDKFKRVDIDEDFRIAERINEDSMDDIKMSKDRLEKDMYYHILKYGHASSEERAWQFPFQTKTIEVGDFDRDRLDSEWNMSASPRK